MSTIEMESDAVYCPFGKVRNCLGCTEFSAIDSPATTKPVVQPLAARKKFTRTGGFGEVGKMYGDPFPAPKLSGDGTIGLVAVTALTIRVHVNS